MRLSAVFLTSLILVACVTTVDWALLDKRMDTWEGASEDEIVMAYGSPQREKTTDSGMKVYTYSSESTRASTHYDYKTGTSSSGGSYSLSCAVDFFMKEGKVINKNYTGNWGECQSFVRSKNMAH